MKICRAFLVCVGGKILNIAKFRFFFPSNTKKQHDLSTYVRWLGFACTGFLCKMYHQMLKITRWESFLSFLRPFRGQRGKGKIVLRSCELFRCVMIEFFWVFPFCDECFFLSFLLFTKSAATTVTLCLTLEAQHDTFTSTEIVILPSSRH